jgi:hypothetical protein
MTTLSSRATLLLFAASLAAGAHAAPLFLGNAFFSVPPNSQYPIVYNQLALNNTSFGIFVAGPFHVAVPPGASSGTLLNYQVKRQLNPAFGSQYMNLTTWLIGSSQPPGTGTYAPTSGYVTSYLDVSGQAALIPISLTNGAATWSINQPGPSFTYTSGTDVYLVQDFHLDASRLSGLFGFWNVELPVESRMVPEPSTLTALSACAPALLLRRRWTRAH